MFNQIVATNYTQIPVSRIIKDEKCILYSIFLKESNFVVNMNNTFEITLLKPEKGAKSCEQRTNGHHKAGTWCSHSCNMSSHSILQMSHRVALLLN